MTFLGTVNCIIKSLLMVYFRFALFVIWFVLPSPLPCQLYYEACVMIFLDIYLFSSFFSSNSFYSMEVFCFRELSACSTQDCFRTSWSSHKLVHPKSKLANVRSAHSEQSQDGWLYCLKSGQARTSKLPHFGWTGYNCHKNHHICCLFFLLERNCANLTIHACENTKFMELFLLASLIKAK